MFTFPTKNLVIKVDSTYDKYLMTYWPWSGNYGDDAQITEFQDQDGRDFPSLLAEKISKLPMLSSHLQVFVNNKVGIK